MPLGITCKFLYNSDALGLLDLNSLMVSTSHGQAQSSILFLARSYLSTTVVWLWLQLDSCFSVL